MHDAEPRTMQRRTLLSAPLLALLADAAGAASATLHVQAVVPAHSDVALLHCDRSLRIDEADLARGWVRCGGSMVLRVRANHANGVPMDMLPIPQQFTSVQVLGPGMAVDTGAGGSRLLLPTVPGERQVALDFRFGIAPGSRAGVYAWPVRLSVAP